MKIINRLISYFRNKFKPEPGVDLESINFLIKPYILHHQGKYFLCYQIKKGEWSSLVHILYSRKTTGKAYYFFSIPISHIESGYFVKRDISEDGFTIYAKKNSVFWLNRNGVEIQLQIKNE